MTLYNAGDVIYDIIPIVLRDFKTQHNCQWSVKRKPSLCMQCRSRHRILSLTCYQVRVQGDHNWSTKIRRFWQLFTYMRFTEETVVAFSNSLGHGVSLWPMLLENGYIEYFKNSEKSGDLQINGRPAYWDNWFIETKQKTRHRKLD